MKKGIVILGHGSRSCVGEANQVVFKITEMIGQRIGHGLIETAIMNRKSELQGLDEAVEKLVVKGANQITVVPMFFANGMHIQSDIPEEIEALRKQFPGISISMTAHIGADPRIADILIERIQEAN